MRSIAAPTQQIQDVYRMCVDSITDENLRGRLTAIANNILVAGADYQQKAEHNKLHVISPNFGQNNEVVVGEVTKEELKNVYTYHMVGLNKPAREIYDLLRSSAPMNRCPFCGVGHVSALDHFLPKSKYPLLSVLPLNLVPTCDKCNKGKLNFTATTAEEQSLHPYFDHEHFFSEQWLFAEISPSWPDVARYFVKAPESWDVVSKKRIESHFVDFKLAEIYEIEAASEISGQTYYFDMLKTNSGRQVLINYLEDRAKSYAMVYVNSWQTALYQALVSANERLLLSEKCPACEG